MRRIIIFLAITTLIALTVNYLQKDELKQTGTIGKEVNSFSA